jgi:hypothetical protein
MIVTIIGRPCNWCSDTGRVTNIPHPYNVRMSDAGQQAEKQYGAEQ